MKPLAKKKTAPCPESEREALAPDDSLPVDYHDRYVGKQSYEDSFAKCFALDWTVPLIEIAWGLVPPFTLLDSGSANGLTLAEFARAGIDAQGIENSPYIHARTPEGWKARNRLGDVRALPFADGQFDVVYDTCLCYLPREDLDRAIRELYRVCRVGVFFAGVAADMTPEVMDEYQLAKGVRSLLTLSEWSEQFLRNGFRRAITEAKALDRAWQVESEVEEDDWYWYRSPQDMGLCFYSK